jgi:hypothetical protein
MARVKDKDVFSFLKSRRIYRPGGASTLAGAMEYLNFKEVKRENGLRSRNNIRKAGKR